MKHLLFIILVVFCFGGALVAKEAQSNEDPKLEQRMKALTEQLRCLVCQNETLADSRADLAEDLRKQIREQMRAGKSDQEILAFLTQRYGDFVLYKPPFQANTILLWLGPALLIAAGTVALVVTIRRRRAMPAAAVPDAAERREIESLLAGNEATAEKAAGEKSQKKRGGRSRP